MFTKHVANEASCSQSVLLQGRTNLPPEKVPWDALRTLMSECIYGGKIDNEFDQVRLQSSLCKVLKQLLIRLSVVAYLFISYWLLSVVA